MISPTVLMLIAAGFALFLAILSILIGAFGASRGQRAVYYAIRRQAQQQASRRYVFAFWCVLFAGVLFGLTRVLPSDSLPETNVPLQTAAPLATARVVAVDVPPAAAEPATALSAELDAATVLTPVVAASPTDSPAAPVAEVITSSATLTSQLDRATAPVLPTPTLAVIDIEPIASATIAAEPIEPAAPTPATEISSTAEVAVTAEVAAVPATIVVAPNQQLSLRAIGTGWEGTGALQGVNTEFAVGTPTIYVFFNFWNVPRGSLLRHTWLQDGKTVSFSSVTFNELGQGTQAISWAPKGGFQAGLYEVRVSLGDTPQFVANFLVR